MQSPDPIDSGRATALGWKRVKNNWPALAAAYGLNLLLVLPLAAALRASLADSLRHREAASRLLEGWDGLWHQSFHATARGIDSSFDPGIVGIGAVFRGLDALVTGALLDAPAAVLFVALAYLLGWTLLSGGLLARFGGDDRGLLRLCGAHAGRMTGLAVVGWLGFWAVLGWWLPWLGAWVDERCRDVIDERVVVGWLLAKYALVWLLMLAIRQWIDYAKVFAVAGHGVPAALRRSAAMLRTRLGAVVGVVLRVGAVGLALLVVYWVVAPGAEQANPFKILVAFLISQASVVARIVVRGWGLASAQALAEPPTPRDA